MSSFGIPVRNGLGVGLLASTSLATRNSSAFTPASLFAAGEQGYWLDPSDFSTMFQDAAGTTPVTAAGQSVRRINDKSGRGNNFTQANVANAPILGVEPFGGRRNLLTFTEQFDNAAWSKQSGATATARSITFAADTISRIVLNVIAPATTPASFTATVYFSTADVGKTVTLGIWTSTLNGVSSGRSANLTIPANGIVTHTWTSGLAGLSVFGILTDTAGGAKTVTLADNVGAQLEVGSTATAYQRVTTAFDVTQAGVADCYYLSFDGTDDWLQSAATINPGSVDKAQVFAGVRKLSDAASQLIVESSISSTTENGTFGLLTSINPGGGDRFNSRGTTRQDVFSAALAPVTRVLTGLADISAPFVTIRANGVVSQTSTAGQGTGNYLTYTHYIGRRGGTTLPLNGRVYQMVMRYGANLTAGQITQTENYVAGETGIYNVEQLNRFAVIDASNASFNAYGAADADSNNYLVPQTVLAADGTPYSVL